MAENILKFRIKFHSLSLQNDIYDFFENIEPPSRSFKKHIKNIEINIRSEIRKYYDQQEVFWINVNPLIK